MKTLLLPLLAIAVLALPAAAPAVVPPKDCGRIEVKSKRYGIKADGVTCRFARRTSKAYLRTGAKPGSGWSCRRYKKSETSLAFRCEKGTTRSVYAIRR